MKRRDFLNSFLSLISIIAFGVIILQAQAVPRVIESVAVRDNSDEIVFTLAEKNLQQYITRESQNSFQLVLPNASSSLTEGLLYSGAICTIRADRKGPDAVFTFRLSPGHSVAVERYTDKLQLRVGAKTTQAMRIDHKPPASDAIDSRKTASAPSANEGLEKPVAAGSADIDLRGRGAGKGLKLSRVTRRPRFADLLNNPGSIFGSEFTDFRQYSPNDGLPVSRSTRAYLGYDDNNLYVAFVCSEEKGKVRAHMAKREDIGNDDTVSVILDTFRDQRRAYIFTANPLGIQWDAITTDGLGSDDSFDAVWYSEGQVTADGFVVLMEIPFKSLRFANKPLQTWGLALKRTIAHNAEEAFYPYVTQREEGLVRQTATLEGIEKISSGRNIQITPYYVASVERTPEIMADPTRQYRTDKELRAGLDAKIVVNNSTTIDLTVNPDFSQVESDEPQVTINKRYENYFPEKRPFFIENTGFFSTPDNLFFSRRIVDPQFGARVTGKAGQWAYGGLVIDDKFPSSLHYSDLFTSQRRAVIGVARIQREFGNQSSVGMFVSNYDLPSAKNRILSIDSRIRLSDNWSFNGQFSRSFVSQQSGPSSSGSAYLANLNRSGRRVNYDLTYTERSPDFHAELGFIPRIDIRQIDQNISYTWRPNSKGIVSIATTGFASGGWDTKNRLQDWYLNGGMNVNFSGLTGIGLSRSRAYELYDGIGFDTEKTLVSAYSDRFNWLGLYGAYYWGTGINYSPAEGLISFRARSSGGNLAVSLRPNTRLSFQQSYIYSHFATERPQNGRRSNIYYNHIFRSKLNYQFNRELSLRFIVDYNAVLPNSSLVRLSRNKQLTTDILLTYFISPGTAIYLGFTDGYESVEDPVDVNRRQGGLSASDRRFFIKANNLFRF